MEKQQNDYKKINDNWHMLTTEDGVFFGLTQEEVMGKAHQQQVAREHREMVIEFQAEALNYTSNKKDHRRGIAA